MGISRWIGVDVGESSFSASLVDERGEGQRSWTVANTAQTRAVWLQEVVSLGAVGLIVEMAESSSERLVQEAVDCGLEVFVVPSTALSSFRVSEGFEDKDDELDGYLLGLMGHRGARSVRPLVIRTAQEQRLRDLTRLRSRLVKRRVEIGQQLRSVLLSLSPEISTKSWQGPKVTSATFLAMLDRWPDLRSLSRAHHSTVMRIARQVGRYSRAGAERIATCLKQWSRDLSRIAPVRLDGAVLEIQMQREQLELVHQQIQRVESELEAVVLAHPAGPRLIGMPGISWRVAAWLCAEAAPLARVMNEPQLATFSGLTPASRSSGKSKRSRLRRNVHKQLSSTYFISAVASLGGDSIDRMYYDKKRRDFQGHPAAHKKATIALARQRHKVIYKIIQGAEYDELQLSRSTLQRARNAA